MPAAFPSAACPRKQAPFLGRVRWALCSSLCPYSLQREMRGCSVEMCVCLRVLQGHTATELPQQFQSREVESGRRGQGCNSSMSRRPLPQPNQTASSTRVKKTRHISQQGRKQGRNYSSAFCRFCNEGPADHDLFVVIFLVPLLF